MSEQVMDPNLQQLASQAIHYQAQQEQLPQLQAQLQSSPEYGDSDSPVDPDAKFYCPFPICNRLYKRKDLLKRHLTTLAASPDEHHHDQGIWDQIREAGVMLIHTRPRNLTEDQKKQRRRESNLRHRVKYAEELKEKRNRKRRVDKLLEGKQVGVQTPDWDAEARENADGQMDGVVDHTLTTETTTRPGRRTGKGKQ